MQDLKLSVKPRDAKNKTDDQVSGVVYGPDTDSTAIAADFQQLSKLYSQAGTNHVVSLEIEGGDTQDVLFKDIQLDPVSNEIRHFDMYAFKKGQKLQATVPVTLTGEAPGAQHGANLSQVLESVEVECTPARLPDHFELDVSGLNEIGDSLSVADLKAGPDVTILTEAEQTVVKLEEVRELEVEDTGPTEMPEEGEATAEGGEGEASGGEDGATAGDQSESAEDKE